MIKIILANRSMTIPCYQWEGHHYLPIMEIPMTTSHQWEGPPPAGHHYLFMFLIITESIHDPAIAINGIGHHFPLATNGMGHHYLSMYYSQISLTSFEKI